MRVTLPFMCLGVVALHARQRRGQPPCAEGGALGEYRGPLEMTRGRLSTSSTVVGDW
jgi:hypothetical protein